MCTGPAARSRRAGTTRSDSCGKEKQRGGPWCQVQDRPLSAPAHLVHWKKHSSFSGITQLHEAAGEVRCMLTKRYRPCSEEQELYRALRAGMTGSGCTSPQQRHAGIPDALPNWRCTAWPENQQIERILHLLHHALCAVNFIWICDLLGSRSAWAAQAGQDMVGTGMRVRCCTMHCAQCNCRC